MIEPNIFSERLRRSIDKGIGAELVETFATEDSRPGRHWISDTHELRLEPTIKTTTPCILSCVGRFDEVAHLLQCCSLDFIRVPQDQSGWFGCLGGWEAANETSASGVSKSERADASMVLTTR
jgi:hypothetical protein